MNAKFSQPVYKWLQGIGIKVSHTYLDHQIKSHPDYPSLAAITDVLDEFGIKNISLVVDKERLDDLPVPFLVHSSMGGEGFVVINNIERQINQDKEFEKHWSGIVVLVEKPVGWYHAENEKALAKEKKIRQQTVFGVVALLLLAGFSLLSHFSISSAGLLLASIAGVGIAILIVTLELGISNEITELLCSAGKETDCNAVINSKGSKLSKWMNWTDAGIIYFISFLLLIVTSPSNPLLSLLSTAAIPFVFFSVYYQRQLLKKWCTLCLLTVIILVLQFVLLFPVLLQLGSIIISLNSIALTAFIFTAIAIAWLIPIKPALKRNKELTDKNYSLLRFKSNPEIFNALLQQQRQVDTIPFENDLQLGNPDSPIQIIVASNPYCEPCAKAHEILHELVEKTDIGLTIRFVIYKNDINSTGKIAIEQILQLTNGKDKNCKKQILYDWYKIMDSGFFLKLYQPQNTLDVSMLTARYEKWTRDAEIVFTPALFVNGFEFPKQYNVRDIAEFVYSLDRKASEQRKQCITI